MAPSKKLLRFTDEKDAEVVIYADSIYKYTETDNGTTIYCNFPATANGFIIPVLLDDLLSRIHVNDEFEIIDINVMIEKTKKHIHEKSA